jgi:anion-transporting  ArsA/GET3 family ATPase
MKIKVVAGKGGVGKSTVSTMLAMYEAIELNRKVLLVDNDGKRAHTISRIMNFERKRYVGNFMNQTEVENLFFTPVNPKNFHHVRPKKERLISIEDYLKQFPEDYGYYPIGDMANIFWGVPVDLVMVEKFLTLISIFHLALAEDIETMILDMEPTEGLERLINNVLTITKSMRGLKDGGILQSLIGQAFEDIGAFFKGPYVRNADKYTERMEIATEAIKQADFILVCIPEIIPIEQMYEIMSLVRSIDGRVVGFVINNPRGIDSEQRLINEFKEDWTLPVVMINHDDDICNIVDTQKRIKALLREGEKLLPFT